MASPHHPGRDIVALHPIAALRVMLPAATCQLAFIVILPHQFDDALKLFESVGNRVPQVEQCLAQPGPSDFVFLRAYGNYRALL